MKLRPYQEKALEEIRAHMGRGTKKILLQLPTGAGKTVIFCKVLKGVKEKGKHAIMVVRGRSLVSQGSDRLEREGVDHGVLMYKHPKTDPKNSIQVCSIDTLRARGIYPKADLIVLDEVHFATSKSYKNFLARYPDAYLLGVTATPYPKKGLGHVAKKVVNPISMKELITQGYLVPPVYYAPFVPDLEGVRVSKSTDDYVHEDIEKKMGSITGDLVSHWIKFGENRKSICFAVSIKHSLAIVQRFKDCGIAAEHIEADTSDEKRKAVLKDLEEGKISVISNVGILCTGVDLPFVSCIIMARPTKSYNLYIQQAGRGTRIFDGKSNFILLDHAGNILRHGYITSEREPILDESQSQTTEINLKRCPTCFAICEKFEKECPYCKHKFGHAKKEVKLVEVDGILVRISEDEEESILVQSFISELKETARRKGYKKGWVYFKLKDRYGETIANKYMPKKKVPQWVLDRLKNTHD